MWTLDAHSEGINGMSLSPQCPGCLVTVSTDKSLKIWDIADNKPECVQEVNLKLGLLHTVDSCPDAPFVFCVGGDKPSDNFKVFDVRDYAAVRKRFGSRKLQNPLGVAEFGFETADEFDATLNAGTEDVDEMEVADPAAAAMEAMTLGSATGATGGVGKKFKKKDKKKGKKDEL